MKKTERLNAVLDLLAESGQVEVEDIVTKLAVSPATARRDLDTLAQQRLLNRTHGGATMEAVAYDLPGRYKRNDHAEQKQAIAIAASSMVPKGSIVGLCGGTTCTAIASVLGMRPDLMESSDRPALTVVTNAINIAAQLVVRPNIKIVVTGGTINPRSYEVVGPREDSILHKISLDFAFIGVNGIDTKMGPSISDEGEAVVISLMAERAAQPIMVADSSKVGKRAFTTMGWDKFSKLITDDGITDTAKESLEQHAIEVITASGTN